MTVTGGIRLAYIQDSFYKMIRDSLSDIGWLTPRPGLRQEVTVLSEQIDPGQEIKPNKVGISSEDILSTDMEVGSNLEENRWEIYIDIFAENEFVGVALAGDIFDIVRGKMSAIGRDDSSLQVKDKDNNDIFICELERVEVNRVRDWERGYNKYWWVVYLEIVDTYYDDVTE